MELPQKNRLNQLLAFYGPLLSKKQNETISDYLSEDLSLSEIAEEKNISRQAISDTIKKSARLLEEFESKLHLLELAKQREKKYQEILQAKDFDEISVIIKKIEELEN